MEPWCTPPLGAFVSTLVFCEHNLRAIRGVTSLRRIVTLGPVRNQTACSHAPATLFLRSGWTRGFPSALILNALSTHRNTGRPSLSARRLGRLRIHDKQTRHRGLEADTEISLMMPLMQLPLSSVVAAAPAAPCCYCSDDDAAPVPCCCCPDDVAAPVPCCCCPDDDAAPVPCYCGPADDVAPAAPHLATPSVSAAAALLLHPLLFGDAATGPRVSTVIIP